MSEHSRPLVSLRLWAADDLGLLQALLGDPAMMVHLGGPESPEAIRDRHLRYLELPASAGSVFAVVLEADPAELGARSDAASGAAVGWVGYWESDLEGGGVWEAGWSVLPAFQGRGIATAAAALLIESARAHGTYRYLHALPRTDNVASNALCLRLGFELLGEADIEYPKGHVTRSTNWRLDLNRP